MIYIKTRVNITDNSGGKIGECIKVLRSKYGRASIGNTIVVAIKKAQLNKKVRLHEVRFGVIVRMAKRIRRKNGTTVTFGDNAIIILDKRDDLQGNRVFGPIASELVINKYNKVVFLASTII